MKPSEVKTTADLPMTEEKPLHVMVAEALGWHYFAPMDDGIVGIPPGGVDQTLKGKELGDSLKVPRFDTDWAATGPLIEKYKIHLHEIPDIGWVAVTLAGDDMGNAAAPTPLIAVCNLILKMRAPAVWTPV